MVRAIGTEFDYCFPPMETSAEYAFTVFRYRIVGHSWCRHMAGMNEGHILRMFWGEEVDPNRQLAPYGPRYQTETVEPIEQHTYPVYAFKNWCGKLMPVPPIECIYLLDDGWKAIAESFYEKAELARRIRNVPNTPTA